MGAEAEQLLRRWKWVAGAALLVTVGSLATLVAALAVIVRAGNVTDDRLFGTWQSDADRTIAGIRELKPLEDQQETALRKLFGKMRITYKSATYTTEFDGTTETIKYEVLGRDEVSVVIREV